MDQILKKNMDLEASRNNMSQNVSAKFVRPCKIVVPQEKPKQVKEHHDNDHRPIEKEQTTVNLNFKEILSPKEPRSALHSPKQSLSLKT
jgi:hypothetical protein